jgi:hypothetical protein
MKNFKSIDCVCCGFNIRKLYDSEVKDLDKYDPTIEMWKSGFVSELSIGYGSCHDGDVFFMGICDGCIEKKSLDGTLIFSRNYSHWDPERISKFEKIQSRKSKIDDILNNQDP